MKNAQNSILVLTVVGLAVLVAGAVYFGAPLFGWVIMAAIFAVFIVDQFKTLLNIKRIAAENELMDACESHHTFFVEGDGVVASRLNLARKLLNKGVRLDSSIAFEVLSNSATIAVPRSSGSSVILLGLMGTFFGLMYSVATAGGAIDNSTTQGTLDTIQILFGNMKGIFGTSLCGLFAALVLNASRAIFLGCRDAFVARLDALTLDMQGDSADGVEKNKNELVRLFDAVEDKLSKVTSSVQEGLAGIVSKVGSEVSSSMGKVSGEVTSSMQALNESIAQVMEKMNASVQNLGGTVSQSLSGAFTPMEQNMKALAASVESVPAKLESKLSELSANIERSITGIDCSTAVRESLEKVAADVKAGLDGVSSATVSSMENASKEISASVADQVRQSNDQWKNFLESLANETAASVESQKQGLETLKSVALQVAEKAQAGSAELSQSVSEKLSALSNDILGAFQKLSETSATLLEAQKALTESIDNRVVKEKDAADALGGNIVETAQLMRVNQSELSANLEMLRSGLETILEKLSGDTAEQVEEENFLEHLNQSLEAFHERASEVLMENAVKTQEILLEVLEQAQRSAVAPQAASKVEG